MINNLRPPFQRQGNKYPLRDKIIPLIPPHDTYVELFAGSGAIFFNKAKAERNILNDLDKKTAGSFKLIMSAPLDVRTYPDPSSLPEVKKYFVEPVGNRIQDRIIHYKIASSYGFSNKPVQRPEQIYRVKSIPRWLKELPRWKEQLKGVIITNQDYENIVKKYDGTHTFFFIDPPYENTDRHFGYAQSTDFDFDRLVDVLKGIKGNFLLTINDSPHTRQLFKDFTIKAVDVPTAWANRDKSMSAVRKELFITNYTMHRRSLRLAEKNKK
jgi:DNA adenine methylase